MNDRLGWIVAPTIEAGRDGLPRLAIAVTDRRGISIPADEATVEAIPIRNADLRTDVRLLPEGEGRFAAEIPLRISGQWEFRVTVRRGGDIYTDSFRRSLGFGRSRSGEGAS
jgi:nitrogen fixation protein FixH